MTGPQDGFDRADRDHLTDEARATASALLDWLGTRVDGLDAGTPDPGAASARPSQSPGPCTWCPICALVAAFRGEQPELTARLTEHATALMGLLRLMVQAHQDPSHGHHHGHHAAEGPAASTTPPPPPGWPAEWGAWDGWGVGTPEPASEDGARADEPGPAPEPHAPAPHTSEPGSPRPAPTPAGARAHGRRVPIRRSSPRSAAFREPPTTDATTDRPATEQASPAVGRGAAPRPGPRPPGGGPRPAPRRPGVASGPPASAARPDRAAHEAPTAPPPSPARPGRPATPPPATPPAATSRPSVQRIAIRRPARPGRTEGNGESAGDTPC